MVTNYFRIMFHAAKPLLDSKKLEDIYSFVVCAVNVMPPVLIRTGSGAYQTYGQK